MSIREPSSTGKTSSSNSAAGTDTEFPSELTKVFRLQFGDVYLNFSPATVAQRASELTPFISVGELGIYLRTETLASTEKRKGSVWKCREWWVLVSAGLTVAAALVQLAAVVLMLVQH